MSKRPSLPKAITDLLQAEWYVDLKRLLDEKEALLLRNISGSFYLIVPQTAKPNHLAPVDSLIVHIYELEDCALKGARVVTKKFLRGNPKRTVALMDRSVTVNSSLAASVLQSDLGSARHQELIINYSPILAMRTVSMPDDLER